jgi:hypothetical protein
VRVHSVLPEPLAAAVESAARGGLEHMAHPEAEHMRAAEAAAQDPEALALIGPFRSRAVAEAVEVTAPAGLPLLAPVATWVGITRSEEPGSEDHPARGRGTVLRMVARDTEVAARLAEDVRAAEQRAFVVAGEHEYGDQLARQLDLVALPRAETIEDAHLVVLCGLASGPEVATAASLGRPVVAFDGVQGGAAIPDCSVLMPFAPDEDFGGTTASARAVELVSAAWRGGAGDRTALLSALRSAGPFDEHGDPVDPPVWLYRAGADWSLQPDRPL